MNPLVMADVDGEPVLSPQAVKVVETAVIRLVELSGLGVRYRLRGYRVKGQEQLAAIWYDREGRQPIFSLTFVPSHWLPHGTDAWSESGLQSAEIAVADVVDSLLILSRIVVAYEDITGFAATEIRGPVASADAS